jgi:hypothetical protein
MQGFLGLSPPNTLSAGFGLRRASDWPRAISPLPCPDCFVKIASGWTGQLRSKDANTEKSTTNRLEISPLFISIKGTD